MSYSLHANKSYPLGLWIMDDSAPFQDHSGRSQSATTKAGSLVNTVASSLVSGALASAVFDRAHQAQVTTPVFQQGKENQPFVLEAWVYPVIRSEGHEPQPYRENLYTRPDLITTAGLSPGGGAGTLTTSSDSTMGKFARITFNQTTAGATNHGIQFTYVPCVAGEVYSASMIARVSKAQSIAMYFQFLNSSGTNIGNNVAHSSPATANTRVPFKLENMTAPAGAVNIRILLYGYSSTGNVPWNSGDTLDGSDLIVEKGVAVGAYFSGLMTGYEWAGTANDSISRTRTDVSAINLAASNFSALGAGATLTTGVTYQGKTWTRISTTTTNHGARVFVEQRNMIPNEYYTGSLLVANDGASAVSVGQDLGDAPPSAFNTIQPGETKRIYVTATRVWDGTYRFMDTFLTVANTNILIADPMVTRGQGVIHEYFNGTTLGAAWEGSANTSASFMYVSDGPTQVLSHNNIYDGITVDGTTVSFTTKYTNAADAVVSYDLDHIQKSHVVGVYNGKKLELWVNGVKANELELTDEQKNATFIATDGNLYTGGTPTGQAVAVNGLATYIELAQEEIEEHYRAGTRVLTPLEVAPAYGGEVVNFDSNKFIDFTLDSLEDFATGSIENVTLADSGVAGNTGVGSWTLTVPLIAEATSIYAMTVDWTGSGFTVEHSLDGLLFEPVEKNKPLSLITNGFDPTGETLTIMVTFDGNEDAILSSLRIIGYSDSTASASLTRDITLTYPAIVLDEHHPFEYHERNGIALNGGSLTISLSADPDAVDWTIEAWVKGTISLSGGGSVSAFYDNGSAYTGATEGEWALYHGPYSAAISGPMVITGTGIVGSIVVYPTALTQAQSLEIYKSYTGYPATRVTDSDTLVTFNNADTVDSYSYAWSTINSDG